MSSNHGSSDHGSNDRGQPDLEHRTGSHDFAMPAWPEAVEVFDTTLRDGSQQEGLSLTVDDKLRVAEQLDHLGVAYIEGGVNWHEADNGAAGLADAMYINWHDTPVPCSSGDSPPSDRRLEYASARS